MRKTLFIALMAMVVACATMMPTRELANSSVDARPALAEASIAMHTQRPTPTPTASPVPTATPAPTPAPLVLGDTGAQVQALQRRLIALGYMTDPADGHFGPVTEVAVNAAKAHMQLSADGKADHSFTSQLDADAPSVELLLSPSGVERIQRRLNALGYLYKGVDGAYGQRTQEALGNFRRENGLGSDAALDGPTLSLLFSEGAAPSSRPTHEYKLIVDISDQRVYAYAWKDGGYTALVRKMMCSTGARAGSTPTGTWSETVRTGARWHNFSTYGGWAQYATHIDETGNIMFHSVLYNKKGGSPTSASVSNLGSRASHGCIRLAVKDAKWIWEHCPDGTTVTIRK